MKTIVITLLGIFFICFFIGVGITKLLLIITQGGIRSMLNDSLRQKDPCYQHKNAGLYHDSGLQE
jgi:hypothetical protein